jgi:hypothetical protein
VLHLSRHRKPAAVLTLVVSMVGTVAINLFYINAFYIMALPCWWIGLLAMALGPSWTSPPPGNGAAPVREG